jgi:hypothetical protein
MSKHAERLLATESMRTTGAIPNKTVLNKAVDKQKIAQTIFILLNSRNFNIFYLN